MIMNLKLNFQVIVKVTTAQPSDKAEQGGQRHIAAAAVFGGTLLA